MNVMPITDQTPVCFGVMCELHDRCARYAAVEGKPALFVIATCSNGTQDRPLFLAVEEKP